MKSKILVLALSFLLISSIVAAQSRWSGVATVGCFQGIYGDDQDESGFSTSAGAFIGISPVFSIGPTVAYHILGQGDYNMLDLDISFQIRKPAGNIKPYASIGGGVSNRFRKYAVTASKVRPLLVLGIGAYFPNVSGALGVGIHAGCRGIFHEIDGGFFGDINLTISLGIYLN